MTQSLTLARIEGISVRLHWTWLLGVGVIASTLAIDVFPGQAPGRGAVVYAALAIGATLVFFASILLHELGHALQARREGVVIDDITLWVFGGIARLRGDFPSAAAELRIALAGPAVTLVLALGLTGAGAAIGVHSAVGAASAWLGYINGVLLVFNLVPAFPLDGGRVLRAALWRRTRDFAAATLAAAKIGRGFGYALIVLGVLTTLSTGLVSGAWLALIGWFLTSAAAAEIRQSQLRTALGGVRVSDVMVRQPVTVGADWSVAEFVDAVASEYHYTAYPVVDGGRVTGLLPLAAIGHIPRGEWEQTRVRDCMLTFETAPSVAESEPLLDALAKLTPGRLGRALVRRGNLVVGLLSITDVGRLFEARTAHGARH